LAEATSHGCPAFQYDCESKGAWAYVELAREVMENG
jgi:chromosome partitioning protein